MDVNDTLVDINKKTNVIYVLADDMGYGDFGLFGDGSSRTPNIDKLCGQGKCLSQYYSASPVCAPARAAILTGRYPHRTGCIDTLEANGLDRIALSEVLLSQRFKENGYATCIVGKWHAGAFGGEYSPLSRGFDDFIGFRGGWSDYFNYEIEQNGEKTDGNGEYLTNLFTNKAVDYIEKHKAEPFFLMVTYNAPHFPFQCPESYVKPFRESGKYNETLSTLYGMIMCMDEGIGRIMEKIEECGIVENTIFVFTSDNGPQLDGDTKRYNCHLKGQKCLTYDGGIRVPAVIRWPGHIAPGSVSDGFMHGCDWFPTFLDACGITFDNTSLDGKSVLDMWLDKPENYGRKRFWQWNRYTPVSKCNAAVRDGKWKLVWPEIREAMIMTQRDCELDTSMKDPELRPLALETSDDSWRIIPEPHPAELYNIEDDPNETVNLSVSHKEISDVLEAAFEQWFNDVEAERRSIMK